MYRIICAVCFGLMQIIVVTNGTFRYYGAYLSFATGQTHIQTVHMNGGSRAPHRKWIVECLDGEAMFGIQDYADDFSVVLSLACQFMFPYKPPTNGLYPYYPSCHVAPNVSRYFCFNPMEKDRTVNTFITGISETVFYPPGNGTNPYKCCKTPAGYYIDYVSCYYVPTHDQFGEFYDSSQHMIVRCGTGFVMTGMAKKPGRYGTRYFIDWIQCCRLGYGLPITLTPPPVIQTASGGQVFYAKHDVQQVPIPQSYMNRYARPPLVGHRRQKREFNNDTIVLKDSEPHEWNIRFTKRKNAIDCRNTTAFSPKYSDYLESKFQSV